jgi:NAD-dependent dihydropyrimidine dehydrogenase PreA subunit
MIEIGKCVWHGIPHEQINWHPTIIAENCVGCGLCVTSCGKNVYLFDYETNKPVVAALQACMVGCTMCAVLCTRDASEFPSVGYVRQIIRKNKLVTQAKNLLRADVEKYNVKQRLPATG